MPSFDLLGLDDEDVQPEEGAPEDEPGLMPLGDVLEAIGIERELIVSKNVAEAEARATSPDLVLSAERMVLGDWLAVPDRLDERHGLTGDDFLDPAFAVIARALLKMRKVGDEIRPILVANHLLRATLLDAAGGQQAVLDLAEQSPLALSTFLELCKIVRDAGRSRRAQRRMGASIERLKVGEDVDEVLGDTVRGLERDNGGCVEDDDVDVRESMNRMLRKLPLHGGRRDLVRTPFPEVDKLLGGGIERGALTILGARPSMGKSAFATDIYREECIRRGNPVGVFSLEVPDETFFRKVLPGESNVPSDLIKSGTKAEFTQAQFDRVEFATRRIEGSPFKLAKYRRFSAQQIVAKIRRWHRDHGVRFVIVDFLQMATDEASTRGRGVTKNDAVGEITKALKAVAVERNIAVLALAALNRDPEKSPDKRPNMSHLRDSGEIESDADVVMFLHREEYYLKEKCPEDKRGVTDVIVAKNRDGAVGEVRLHFYAPFVTFIDPEKPRLRVHDGGAS